MLYMQESTSPFTLHVSIFPFGSGRLPSNGAPQSNQGSRGQGPKRDESTSCQAAGAIVALAPLSARTRLVPRTNKQRATRLEALPPRAHYPDRRVVTSASLALRRAWRVHDIDRSRQERNCRITLWPNPLTRPKPQGLLSGTTIRDTLIGVLRSL